MEIIKPRTLSGFMELLPDKQIRFEKMVEILRTTPTIFDGPPSLLNPPTTFGGPPSFRQGGLYRRAFG